ncbi:MAG TPA: flippase [Bacteroidota bacterium]|nr:flippase [Bacteroidota bacterium]
MTVNEVLPSRLPHQIRPRSVAINSLFLFGFQVVTKILALIASIILANHYNTQLFGQYNIGFAVAALCVPFADLGLEFFFLRETAQKRPSDLENQFGVVLASKLVFGFLSTILIIVIALALSPSTPAEFLIIAIAGMITISRSIAQTFTTTLRGFNRADLEASLLSVARLLDFVIIIVCVRLDLDILRLLQFLLLGNIFSLVVIYAILRVRYLRPTFVELRKHFIVMAKGALPFALTALMTSIYFNLDTVLVAKFVNEGAAGIYRAAYNLMMPLLMISTAVSGAVFPYVSQQYQRNPREVADIVMKSAAALFMIGLPCAVITTGMSDDIVQFLFRKEYAESAVALRILIWFIPLGFTTNLFGNVLGAMNEQRVVLKISVINAVFNVGSNLIIIPRFAQNGAAATTVATELLGCAIFYYYLRTKRMTIVAPKPFAKVISACALLIPFFFVPLRINAPEKLAAFCALYTTILWLLGGFKEYNLLSLLKLQGRV